MHSMGKCWNKHNTWIQHYLPESVSNGMIVVFVFSRWWVAPLLLLHLPAARLRCAAALRSSPRRFSGDRGSASALHRASLASVAHFRVYTKDDRHIVTLMSSPFHRCIASTHWIQYEGNIKPAELRTRCAMVVVGSMNAPWHTLLPHKGVHWLYWFTVICNDLPILFKHLSPLNKFAFLW